MEAHHFSGQTISIQSDNSKVNAALIEENKYLKERIKELEEQLHELAERECVLCKKKIKELEETKSKMYDANQLMNANIKELEATISKLEKVAPKWISVEDGMPDNDTWVLVYHEGEMDVDHYLPGVYTQGFLIYEKVTHWMPLPSAPTTEESPAVEKDA